MESRPSFDTIQESAQDAVTLARQLAAEIDAGADIDICATLSRDLFAKVHPLATIFDTLAGVLLAKEQIGASEAPSEDDAINEVIDLVAQRQHRETTNQEGAG